MTPFTKKSAIVLLGIGVAGLVATELEPNLGFAPKSKQTLYLRLGDKVLQLPRAYIARMPAEILDCTNPAQPCPMNSSVDLALAYPGFVPVSPERAQMFDSLAPGHYPDLIEIFLSTDDNIAALREVRPITGLRQDKYGLYEDGSSTELIGPVRSARQIGLQVDSTAQTVEVFVHSRTGLIYQYIYNSRLLPYWSSIDNNVMRLMNSWQGSTSK